MSQKDYDLRPRWYVVHTYSGYENKVKTDLEKTIKNRELQDFFFDIIVPMEEQIEIKDGKFFSHKKQVELPEMMERIESYHKQIVSKILEDRQLKHEKQNNKNSKIIQFTDYAGHDSNDEPGEK